MGLSDHDKPAGDPAARAQEDKARAKPHFVPAKQVTVRGDSGGPPTWAVATVIASIALVVGIFALTRVQLIPSADSEWFYIGLIALPMLVLLVVAVASKLIELQRAKSWAQTAGTVVRSEMETRRHRFAGEPEKIENAPAIEYEFSADGRKIRGTRIAIGDDTGGANAEATLARYPVGTSVTVYYDPADPKHCVLERSGPQGVTGRGCLEALIALALVVGAIAWLIVQGPAFIDAHFPKAEPAIVIFASCFGLAVLLFFFSARRTSKQAQSWPSVRGKIVRSEVESYREVRDGRTTTMYRPAVEFAYQVHGREFHANQIKLNMTVSGGQGYAEKVVAKYPAGREVDVHYDPANPSNAALENPTGATWLLLIIALAMFALAVWQLGVFG